MLVVLKLVICLIILLVFLDIDRIKVNVFLNLCLGIGVKGLVIL